MLDYQQYFEFLRYSIAPDKQYAFDTKDLDWYGLYRFAKEQAILGVLFEGIKRINKENIKQSSDVFFQWLALSEQIYARNKLLNSECTKLTLSFEREGHKTAILKGQANARLYPNPLSRQPGDIDIYVDGGENKVMDTLFRLGLISSVNIGEYEGIGRASRSYHHVHLPSNENGVDVEVHFRPSSGVWNPFSNKKIQEFLKNEMGSSCKLVDKGFRVPSIKFSLVMQLAHIQNHFMNEGIGFRQIIDYYYLLESKEMSDIGDFSDTLHYLGLEKIAGAVMWVLKEVMGISHTLLIAPIDEKRGNMLLKDIIHGGNFGKCSFERQQNQLNRFVLGRKRHIRLMYFDFKESFWFELKYWRMQTEKTFLRIKRRSWTIR